MFSVIASPALFPNAKEPAELIVASDNVTLESSVVPVSPAPRVATPLKITLAVLASPLAVVSAPKVTSPPDMVIATSVPVPIAVVPPTVPENVLLPTPDKVRFCAPLNNPVKE